MSKNILVVKKGTAKLLHRGDAPDLVTPFWGKGALDSGVSILDKVFPGAEFLPRDQMETDENYLQLIPYVVLCNKGRIFSYTRGGSGGEDRLHAKKSIGLGGHIDEADGWWTNSEADTTKLFLHVEETILEGAKRELREELGIAPPINMNHCRGFLYDPTTPVGRVHLGILFVVEVSDEETEMEEDVILNGAFRPSRIIAAFNGLEVWSALALSHILNTTPEVKHIPMV